MVECNKCEKKFRVLPLFEKKKYCDTCFAELVIEMKTHCYFCKKETEPQRNPIIMNSVCDGCRKIRYIPPCGNPACPPRSFHLH